MTASLYRKYRPQTFGEVVGQDAISRTLRNAIAQNKVSHAYLFCGPRGTGKTTTARLMAKALLCQHGPTPDPDGDCPECLQIAEGMHPDVYELDAASRTGVENVREEIIGRVNFAPTRGRSKVYIIDEVHMLSVAAFNALLKTLEEPPGHVVFILCTTDPQKVPATIHSRCQRFDFHRISNEEIVTRLGAICVAEDVTFEPEALDLIAARSEGGMRNALTTLEQLMVFCEGKVSLAGAQSLLGSLDAGDMATVMEAVGRRDAAACFAWTADYVDSGADLAQFVRDMVNHVRTMYVLSVAGEDAPVDISDEERKRCEVELPYYSVDRLSRLLGILGELQNELRFSNNPRLSFEIALTRMVRPDSDITLEALAERVATLEKALAARSAMPAVSSGVAASSQPASVGSAAAAVSAPTGSAGAGAVSQAVPAAPAASSPAAAPRPAVPVVASALQQNPAVPAEPARGYAYRVSEASRPARSVQPASVGRPMGAVPSAQPGVSPVSPSTVPSAAVPSAMPAVADIPASNGAGPNLKNPAALQRSWQSALTLVKKEKAAYGVFFLNTVVTCNEAGDQIVVTYPAGSNFAFDAVRKPEVQTVLHNAIIRAFGTDIPVQFIQEGRGAGSGVVAPVAPAASAAASAPAASASNSQRPASAPAASSLRSATVPAAAPSAAGSGFPASPEPLRRHMPRPAAAPQPAASNQAAAPAAQPAAPQTPTPLRPAAYEPAAPRNVAPANAASSMMSASDEDPILRAPSRRSFNPMPAGPDYEYDEVPLDAYDSYAASSDYDSGYYDDSPYEAVPAQTPYGASASAARSAASASAMRQEGVKAESRSAGSGSPAAPSPDTAASASASPVQASFNRQPAANSGFQGNGEESIEDIQNMLSSSFGNEIIFQEVD